MASLIRQCRLLLRRRRVAWWLSAVVALVILLSLIVVGRAPAAHVWLTGRPTGQVSQLPAFSIDTSVASARAISPLLYGFGAGVSTSTYAPPQAGLAPVLATRLRQAGATAVRFGADSADILDWQKSVLYGDEGIPHAQVGDSASRYPAIDSFRAFAGANGLQPIITVNGEIDDPRQAAQLVDYVETHSPSPPTYWEIGNEPYSWQHFALPLDQRRVTDQQKATPDEYAAVVVAYSKAMQAAASRHGHHLRIIADEWITNATDQSWTASVDVIDTHYYAFFGPPSPPPPPHNEDIAQGAVTSTAPQRPSLASWLADLQSSIRGFAGSEDLQVMVGSWGIDGGGSSDRYSDYTQGLFVATMLSQMIAGGVTIANMYPFYGEDQSLLDPHGAPRAGLYVFDLYTHHFGRWAVPVRANAAADNAHLWAVAAATSRRGGDMTILVINGDPLHARRATLALGKDAAAHWQPVADLWTLSPDAPDSAPFYGTHGLRHTVARLNFTTTGVSVSLPPYTLTLFHLRRR